MMDGESLWLHIYRLLEQGADAHPQLIAKAEQHRGPMGESFLHWVCLEGSPEVIARLLKYDIDVNAQNSLGNTALMEAAAAGRWEVAKVLKQAGADPEICNYDAENLADYLDLYGVELPDELL